MENSAQKKLLEVVGELESYFGNDITEVISTLDRYTNYYHHNENLKRELLSAYNGYKNNDPGSGEDNLLSTVEDCLDLEDWSAKAIQNNMFDIAMIKKFIADLAVVFTLNIPEKERKSNSIKQ